MAAIVATGTAVLLVYRVRASAVAAGLPVGELRARTVVVVAAMVTVVAVPLGAGTYQAFRNQAIVSAAQPAADATSLRAALDGAGLDGVRARLSETLGGTRDLPVGEGS